MARIGVMGLWVVVLVVCCNAIAAVGGVEGSRNDNAGPALSFWRKELPKVEMPPTLRRAISPVDGSSMAGRFASSVAGGSVFPSVSESFCKAAGLVCDENTKITPYVGLDSALEQDDVSRALGIKTINDFQFDFFLESHLEVGAEMLLAENLHDPIPSRPFLPRAVAGSLPALTSSSLPKLLQTFNIGEKTEMSKMMGTAVYLCENPALPGEERACPTSVEAMAEFVSSQIGPDVEFLTTTGAPADKPSAKAPVKVVDFTKRSVVEGENIVICHNVMFPSALYYCHHVTGTKVVQASLAALDGSVIHAVAICHLDTSLWASEHPAFTALNIPRGAEACHWSTQNDLIWVPSH